MNHSKVNSSNGIDKKKITESSNFDNIQQMDILQFTKQSIDQIPYTSILSNELNNQSKVVPSDVSRTRRRSSFLRRMSVGAQIDYSVSGDFNKILKIDIHKSTNININDTENAVEEENEDEGSDVETDDSDDDTELYKRSNSKTPACRIEDFKPLKVLGQGAYGKVLLVKNKNTGKLFAQKELKKASIIMNNKNIERTISERKILSEITSHENIVKLFYALHDKSKLYLLMEYIPGGELFKYLIQEKFLNEQKTSFYIIQMAHALKFLHDFGIVYRDLKPENCLLDKDGYLILTDFGLAKKSSDDLENNKNWCNSIIGTPEYCAPEVLKGQNYGTSADWWSLGCVTFDLLTGNPPFTGNNHKKIIDKVIKEKPKYPFYITTTSKELLNKLLNKNPDKRFNVDKEWSKFGKLQFFRYYKFNDIKQRKVEPPIKPIISDPEKAENFDPEFTNMKLSNLNINGIDIQNSNSNSTSQLDHFTGFSYTASNSFVDNYL
jgi:serine/threonine protein kinase